MRHLLPLSVGLFLAWGAPALADPAPAPATPAPAEAPAAVPDAPADARNAAAKPLSTAELSGISAGDKITVSVLSNQQLTGSTIGNTVTADTVNTGAISLDPQALSNFNGVGNFVMNTGANNTLQGSININIVTTPGAP